ncbi:MAG: prephenate dehydrogenase/arogenate dehydrogenase family protein [Deltaproteobacteria bacterium]
MTSIATIGPKGSHAWQAAQLYDQQASITVFSRPAMVIEAFERGEADLAVIPVYNTREGESREYFRAMELLRDGSWIDNIVLPIHLSLGALDDKQPLAMLISTSTVFKQCEEYIASHYPSLDLMAVQDLDQAIHEVKAGKLYDRGIIEAEEVLKVRNFTLRDREIVSHNRTRFAVIGRKPAPRTGYDATAFITRPMKDRVGLLYDILGEFTRRAVNLLDLKSETDVKTQELQIYIEVEGHIEDTPLSAAISRIEHQIIQEPGAIRTLGSFPRVDMRTKLIDSFGFIGTGEMSKWFAAKLENEGYKTVLTGRSTPVRPEQMIEQVNVVVICVPISVTVATVEKYGPLLREDQALILLAGEAENILEAALSHTRPGVEIMLVHNLWGPQAANMKNKIAAVVRTVRSGSFCSEFEAFLYKHGAEIHLDSPNRHDLLMGVGQKLPTCISVALALTLQQNGIVPDDINSHATLTSLYGILAMSRVHNQNDRTYAEILATRGDGRKIVHDFITNIMKVQDLADREEIATLCRLMEENRNYLTDPFLKDNMKRALAVDEALTRTMRR